MDRKKVLNGARGVYWLSGGEDTAIIIATNTGIRRTHVDLKGNRRRNGVVFTMAMRQKNPIERNTAALGVPSVMV